MIRAYKPEDRADVENCIIELQDFERSIEPDRVEGISIAKRYLSDLINECRQKTGQLFVAEVNGKVAGFTCVWLEHETGTYISSLTDYAYISDLAVLPPHRRSGLGKALLKEAEAFAIQHGAKVMRIEVLAKNHIALDVYRKAGFQDYEIALQKSLVHNNYGPLSQE